MKLLKRVFVGFLAIAMILGSLALVACSEDQGGEQGTGGGDVVNPGQNGATQAPMTGDELIYLPQNQKYKNYEFKMYARQQDMYGIGHFCYQEGAEDVINQALREREFIIQDKMGAILTLDTSMNDTTIYTNLASNHKGQKHFGDALFIPGTSSMEASMAGYLWNLNILEELNLEASYYDQRIQQDFRIADMLFQITGDYEVQDELVTFGVLYNDFIYNGLGYYDEYGSPYQMVSNYLWTYDMMLELAQPFTADLGGENPQDNQWGIVSEAQAVYYFYMGSGLKPMVSENGELNIKLNDATEYELTTTALSKLLNFTANENVLIAADIVVGSSDRWEIASDIFEQNRALFRTTALSDALFCSDMEKDFGILPIPMYDAAQKQYYSMVNAEFAFALCIPYYVKDIHKTANIIEAISYYSRYGGDETLYEAFFVRLSDAKICRKTEDRQMLTLIFNNKVYDIDAAVKNGIGLRAKVMAIAAKKNGAGTIASDINSALKSVNIALPKTIDVIIAKNENQSTRYGE